MTESKKEWYVVNTYAGHENRVKENLQRRVDTMGISDYLFRILVAEEPEIEYKNGKKVEKNAQPVPRLSVRGNDYDGRSLVYCQKYAGCYRIYRIQRRRSEAVPGFPGRN